VLIVELSVVDALDVSLLVVALVVVGVVYVSSVVNALCAPLMLLSESAVETLERNSPNGLLESAFDGVSFSASARYFFASVVSPDLMADSRLESALLKLFCVLLVELVADEAEDAASSVKRVVLLCKAEMDMKDDPFHANFSDLRPLRVAAPRYTQN
jgi:hypothetical protein